MMLRMVKLVLIVNEEASDQLQAYGRIFKHEVYKIAGVFGKRRQVFAFPYRYLSDRIAWSSQRQVMEQAAQYYRLKQRRRRAKLDFIACWSGDFVYEDGKQQLQLPLSDHDYLILPFVSDDAALAMLHRGKITKLTLKQRGEFWFAFVWIEGES